MKFFKKIFRELKEPRVLFLVLFYVGFAAALTGAVLLLLLVPEQGAFQYLLYGLSAIGLAYFVYTVIYLSPKVKGKIVTAMSKHRFTDGILKSYGFRTLVFASVGFAVNVAYTALQAIIGIVSRSVWNIVIAVFYLALIAVKSVALFCAVKYEKNAEKQVKAYRACGYMLNLLTFAMSGIIALIFSADMTFEYAGVMIYAVAAYTFYKIITAVYQIFKAKKQDSLAVQAIRNINLTSALYSILVLQVAMFQAFGERANHFSNGITGGVVAAIILTISIIMIVKSYRKVPESDSGEGDKPNES